MSRRKRTAEKKKKSKFQYLDNEINSDKLVDDITCKGCFQIFSPGRVPKILLCLHTLCSECITRSIAANTDKNKVNCCSCKMHSVAQNPDSFRTHSFVQILSDIASCYEGHLNGTLRCIGCKNVAGLRCLTCNENYCQEHTDFHVRSRATSHHKVLTFKQILNSPLLISTIKREENCPSHTSKILEFFCYTCKLPICTSCALAQHKSCVYEELGVAISALKQKFENLKPAFNRKAYNLKKMDTLLGNSSKQLEGEFSNCLASVGDMSDKIMRTLRQKEASFNHEIEDHRKDSLGELRVCQSLVEDKISNIESGVEFVDTVFEYWSPLEVLTVENEIVKRLTELSTEEDEFNADNLKPKPYEVPPDTGKAVADAISQMKNGAFATVEQTT